SALPAHAGLRSSCEELGTGYVLRDGAAARRHVERPGPIAPAVVHLLPRARAQPVRLVELRDARARGPGHIHGQSDRSIAFTGIFARAFPGAAAGWIHSIRRQSSKE